MTEILLLRRKTQKQTEHLWWASWWMLTDAWMDEQTNGYKIGLLCPPCWRHDKQGNTVAMWTNGSVNTVMILNFRTDRPEQTVQTQIRVYTVCNSVCIFWTHYTKVKQLCTNFRVITAKFSVFKFLELLQYLCSCCLFFFGGLFIEYISFRVVTER